MTLYHYVDINSTNEVDESGNDVLILTHNKKKYKCYEVDQ
jgi:hypothetical protein